MTAPKRTVNMERGLMMAHDTAGSSLMLLNMMLEGPRVGKPLDEDARRCVEKCIGHFNQVVAEIQALKNLRILEKEARERGDGETRH
jgi:hypothetical protein